jgi:hypothetical protein
MRCSGGVQAQEIRVVREYDSVMCQSKGELFLIRSVQQANFRRRGYIDPVSAQALS